MKNHKQPPQRRRSAPYLVNILILSICLGTQLPAQTASPLTIRLGGDIQFDSRNFINKPNSTGTFLFKDVRPSIRGNYAGVADFRLLANFAGSKLEMQEAYAIFLLGGGHRLQAGKFKAPVSLEVLQSNVFMSFIEAPYTYALAPRRDLGVCLHSSWLDSRLETSLGLFNGTVDGLSEDIDNATQKDFVARLFAQPLLSEQESPFKKIGIGFAVSAGTQRGQASSDALVSRLGQVRTAAGTLFFKYNPASFSDGRKVRFVPQVWYYYKRFGLLSELIVSRARVTQAGNTADLTNRAFDITLSYMLTDDEAAYSNIKPKAPLTQNGGTGAWEAAFRVHHIRFDASAFPRYADSSAASDALTLSLGANWHLNETFKLMANFERTAFTAGNPGKSLPKETSVLARMQILF